MLTPATERLMEILAKFLQENQDKSLHLINIGAGMNIYTEEQMASKGYSFICDRVDIDECRISHPTVGDCYQCSVEDMKNVKSEKYDLGFSNYVLEHVEKLDQAASEIYRVLKPGAVFITTVPNPTAIEFFVAKHTPLWFHKWIRGGTGWETHYSYKNIKELCGLFKSAGMELVRVDYYSCVEGYLERFPVLNILSRIYDRLNQAIGIHRFMGNVCITFRKPE